MLRSARRAASLTRGLRLTLAGACPFPWTLVATQQLTPAAAAPTALEATTTAFTANSHVFAVGATRSLCTASPEPSPVHHARRDAEEASTSETADSSLHRTQMLDAALKHVKTMVRYHGTAFSLTAWFSLLCCHEGVDGRRLERRGS